MPRSAAASLHRLSRVAQRLYGQTTKAARTASTAQWVAYAVVAVALVLLVAVCVHRVYTVEHYAQGSGGGGTNGPKSFSQGQAGNCQPNKLLSANAEARRLKEQCNQGKAPASMGCKACSVNYPLNARFQRRVRVVRPTNADAASKGMDAMLFCDDPKCQGGTRTLQNVVDEYEYTHVPKQFQKVMDNHTALNKGLTTMRADVCAYSQYAKDVEQAHASLTQETAQRTAVVQSKKAEALTLIKALPSSVRQQHRGPTARPLS